MFRTIATLTNLDVGRKILLVPKPPVLLHVAKKHSAHVEANGQRDADCQHALQVKTNAASYCKQLLSRRLPSFKPNGNASCTAKKRKKPQQTDFSFSLTDLEVRDVLHSERIDMSDNDLGYIAA